MEIISQFDCGEICFFEAARNGLLPLLTDSPDGIKGNLCIDTPVATSLLATVSLEVEQLVTGVFEDINGLSLFVTEVGVSDSLWMGWAEERKGLSPAEVEVGVRESLCIGLVDE